MAPTKHTAIISQFLYVSAAFLPFLGYFWWHKYVTLFDAFESAAISTCSLKICPRFSLADLCGSTLVCQHYREYASFPKYFLETLIAVTMIQFGGTTFTGLILGQTPSWVSSATAFPALLLIWWLTFFCPGDYWSKLVQNKYIKIPIYLGAWASSAHSVSSWGMDKAFVADHKRAQLSSLVAITCGTISACGGGILSDLLNLKGIEWKLTKPNILKQSTKSFENSLICALFYYFLLDPFHLFQEIFINKPNLENKEVRAIIGLLMYELNLVVYFFPKTNIHQYFGQFLSFVFRITPVVNPYRHMKVARTNSSPNSSPRHQRQKTG